MSTLVSYAQLKAHTNYDRLADIEKCLSSQGIVFFRGRNGIFTTMELINAAGGIVPANNSKDAKAQASLIDRLR